MKRQLGEIGELKAELTQKDALLSDALRSQEDKTANVKAIQQTVDELKMAVKQKDIDLEAQVQRNDALRLSIKSRKDGSMQVSSKRAEALEADLVAKEGRLEDTQQKLRQVTQRLSATEADALNRAAENDASTKQMETSHLRKVESLKAELAESKLLKQKLADDVRSLSAKLQSSQQDVNRISSVHEEHRSEHRRVVAMHEERNAILEKRAARAAQSGLSSADDQGHAHRAELTQLESQVSDLQQRLEGQAAEASTHAKAIRAELHAVVESRDTALRQVHELESQLAEAAATRTRLAAELAESQRSHDTSEQAVLVVKQRCERLERDVTNAKAGLSLEQQQKSSLEQLINTLQQTLKEKESQGNMMRSTSREKEDQLVSKSEELISAIAEAAAIRLKFEAAAAALTDAQDEHATTVGASCRWNATQSGVLASCYCCLHVCRALS